jgi:hypothetical protein
MSDKLTLELVEKLKNQTQLKLNRTPTTQITQPSTQGKTLFEQLNQSLSEEVVDSDKKSGVLHGLGAATWNVLDSALFSLPSIGYEAATGEKNPYDIMNNKTEGMATFGKVVGQGIGFLLPMKYIGLGIRGGVSAINKLGTTRVVGEAAEAAAKFAGKSEFGLGKELVESSVRKGLNDKALKGPQGALSKYEISMDEISKVEGEVRASVFNSLKKDFANVDDELLLRISDEATGALKGKGIHINNLTDVIGASLNTKLGTDTSNKITRYFARAADQAVLFSTYNLIQDGVYSIATEKEFDPAKDVGDALLFSAFLPAVDMIGGGGRVPVMRTANALRKALKKVKQRDYNELTADQANGLLRILTRDNYLKDSTIGQIAGKYSFKSLEKKDAVKAIKEIMDEVDPSTVWKSFYKEAKEDVTASMGRMIAGGLYFDLNTILDTDLILAMEGEELAAHFITGAFFSRMKRPLFEENYKNINSEFSDRIKALNYLGLDATALEHYGKAFNDDIHFSAAYSGIIDDPVVKKIEQIFETKDHRSQSQTKEGEGVPRKAGSVPNSRIALYAHDLYKIVALQKNLTDARVGDNFINIDNLTADQIQNISKQLESIEITQGPLKGKKLSIDNFETWKNGLMDNALNNVGALHIQTLKDIATRLGIQHDADYVFDMEKPFKIADVFTDKVIQTDSNYHEISEFLKLRKTLEQAGFVETITQPTGEMLKIENLQNDAKTKSDIIGIIKTMTDQIRLENYGENYPENIMPDSNAFIYALQKHKYAKKREALFNIAEGNIENLSDRQQDLYRVLVEQFGDKVPKIQDGDRIELTAGEMSPEDFSKLKTENKFDDIEYQINLIAQVWGQGTGKTRGVLKPGEGNKLTFDKAETIVNAFRKEGYEMNQDLVREQQRWHYSRILNSPNITPNHISILENIQVSGFARIDTKNNRKILIIPDESQITSFLNNPRLSGLSREEAVKYVDKYKKSLQALSLITGDYIDVESSINLEQSKSIVESIDSMYRLTTDFNKEVFSEYKQTIDKLNEQGVQADNITNLINKLYINDEEAGIVGDRKQITDAKERDEINFALDEIIKNPPDGLTQEFLGKLSDLKDNINQEFINNQVAESTDSIAKEIERTIESLSTDNRLQTMILDNFLYDANINPDDSVDLKRRTDRMTSRFATYLRNKHGEDLQLSENPTFKEVIAEANRKGDAKYILKNLSKYLEVFRRGYNEEKYFEIQAAEAQAMSDYSTLNISTSDAISPTTLSVRYEKFNEELKQDNLKVLIENANLALSESGISGFKKEFQNIRDEINKALVQKHTYVDDEGLQQFNPEAYNKELESFNREALPQLINNIIGRDYVKSVTISQDSQGRASLELSNRVVGKGVLSEFAKEFRDVDNPDNNIDILIIDKTGTWNGRKTDILEIPNLADVIENSRMFGRGMEDVNNFIKGSDEAVQENDRQPMSDFVSVIVSQNTTLAIPTNQTINGQLTKKFKSWYDSKLASLDSKSKEYKHYQKIYGDFVKNTESAVSKSDARQMLRAMYFDKISSSMFNDIVKNADNSVKRDNLASGFFKYVSLGEATGAKVQANKDLLEVLKGEDFLSDDQNKYIDEYLNDEGLNIVTIADETAKKSNPLTAGNIYKQILKDSGYSKELIKENSDEVGNDKLFKSIISSSMNAQSYLSHKAASLLYLHKGRDATASENKHGTAGVKPTVHFNENMNSVLMKTNFVYDSKIADLMEAKGVDILTTESAAKAFYKDKISLSADDMKAIDKVNDINISSSVLNKITDANKDQYSAKIKLENIFLGKVEDRKRIANVTYAISDFLDSDGYKSFRDEFVDYDNKLDAYFKMIGELSRENGNRQAATQFLFRKLREDNLMFEDSANGSVETLMSYGIDPNSIFVRSNIRRTATQALINGIRSPKTKGASYSVLIPYLEGSVPLFQNVGNSGERVQIGIGGKKLSYEDRSTQMTDVNKIQYILEITRNDKKRDIQVSRIAGKFVVQDPYNELSAKDISKEIKQIERIEATTENNRTMGRLFDEFKNINERSDTKYYLENLSLRMPNLGGDVAIQKVEGFYNREQGNVVGINVYDIAQTHQADFDVDMAFNYHLKSSKLSNSIWKDLGSSVDAYIFPTDLSSMDIFGFGKTSDGEVAKAGLGTGYDDNLSNHMKLYQQSKKNFGVVKKLSTELSFFLRSPNLIDLSELGVTSISKSNKTQYRAFLQAYKNTLQSIIDAAKKPNWASKADQQEILDYILFGDKPTDYNLDNKLSNYGQDGFNGFFTIEGAGKSREIKKDIIKEIIRVKSKSQRILTDVFDASGRRAPEANEIGMVRSELNSFYNNPSKFLYDRLSFRYRNQGAKKSALNDMFFNDILNTVDDYKEVLRGGLQPKNILVNIDRANIQQIKDSTISGFLIEKMSQDKLTFESYSDKSTKEGAFARQGVEDIMDRLNAFRSLSPNADYEALKEQLDADDGIISDIPLRKYLNKYNDGSVSEREVKSYSLLHSALEKQRTSLQRFIRNAGKNQTESVLRAKDKLKNTHEFLDYLNEKENEIIEKSIGKTKGFYQTRTKNIKFGSKGRIYNNKNTPAYVYQKITNKEGKIFFKEAGWIAPRNNYVFSGGEYYIIDNPIRYADVTKKEYIDAISMLMQTGDIQIRHLGIDPAREESFIRDFNNLNRMMSGLVQETYTQSKDSPFSKENWDIAKKVEDNLVSTFIEKYSDGKQLDLNQKESAFNNLIRYMLKPQLNFSEIGYAKNTNVKMPGLKQNKRLGSAVFRHLKDKGHNDLLEDIVRNYGAEFRRRYDDVHSEQESRFYRSDLYAMDDGFYRTYSDPTLEYAVTNRLLFDSPALSAHFRHDIGRLGNTSKNFYDSEGNYSVLFKYGNYKDIDVKTRLARDDKDRIIGKDETERLLECYR